jgi:hypothetical protein
VHVPAQVSADDADDRRAARAPVRLRGDTYITITAPFYPDDDPLTPGERSIDTDHDDLDGTGVLVRQELPLSLLLRGTLTYQLPRVEVLTGFAGGPPWRGRLRDTLNELATAGRPDRLFEEPDVVGMVFPDGYGSVAVTVRVPGGWDAGRREATLAALGADGREPLAARLREELLPPLQRMLRRCGGGRSAVAVLPYFNLTYAGSTDHPEPGRAALDDALRPLVYPDSALPLRSSSPWWDEYLYTGYAYHLLASHDPEPNLRKLSLLLLILNVLYARLARFASAADEALSRREHYTDLDWLARTERQLRAQYQSLITPTFSFDHHALRVRDAVLRSWDVPKLQVRADNLLSMLRNAVELQLASNQARRSRRLNLFVVILAALTVIPTTEAVVNLIRYLNG